MRLQLRVSGEQGRVRYAYITGVEKIVSALRIIYFFSAQRPLPKRREQDVQKVGSQWGVPEKSQLDDLQLSEGVPYMRWLLVFLFSVL